MLKNHLYYENQKDYRGLCDTKKDDKVTKNANYRKHNDRTHNSSTYHKKDGTPIRHLLKQEAKKEIDEEKLFLYLASEPIPKVSHISR